MTEVRPDYSKYDELVISKQNGWLPALLVRFKDANLAMVVISPIFAASLLRGDVPMPVLLAAIAAVALLGMTATIVNRGSYGASRTKLFQGQAELGDDGSDARPARALAGCD